MFHYSKELIERFRQTYQEACGLEITPEVAEIELENLARLLEIFYLSVFTKEENYDGDGK